MLCFLYRIYPKVVTNRFYACCMFIFCATSCENHYLNPSAYCHWLEDISHGLRVVTTKGAFQFTLQYKPWEYVTLKEKGRAIKTKKDLESSGRQYQGMQHYNLQLLSKEAKGEVLRVGAGSDEVYQERISYFSYPAQQDFMLIDGKDTLPCLLYHFERSYALAPYCNMVLGFAAKEGLSKEDIQDKTLVYDDRMLGCGKTLLTVKAEDIRNLPEINLPK